MATSKLVTYEWNFKKFTSQDRLNDLFLQGLIDRTVIDTETRIDIVDGKFVQYEAPMQYGAHYVFSTKDGRTIARFYKDNSFGFCSQATGVELVNVTSL